MASCSVDEETDVAADALPEATTVAPSETV
jgi:hypothetical protein